MVDSAAEARLRAQARAKTAAIKADADPLAALQTSVAASKAQVEKKNIEIPTIALEQAVNTGDTDAIRAAATELGKAQGLTGSELRTFSYNAAQDAAKGTKPTPPPADANFTYDYVWRQNVGGPGGKWTLTKSPILGVTATDSTTTASTTTASTTTDSTTTASTDPAILTLIESLQKQIASLTANNQQSAIDKTAADAAAKQEKAENAIAVLTDRFTRYGLASLVPKIKQLAISGASESTITLQLQESEEYKTRFKANQDRIKKGLTVLDPGTYLGLEDRYRQIIRAYGLKQFDNDSYVTQFISNDVSPEEVSSRVVNAVQRVQNADPAVSAMLRQYYNIGVTDMVAYVLDPTNQLPKIERQIGAAEIGVAAGRQGLTAGVNVAEQLAAQGVTEAEARRGYSTIADILPQATKLSQIYTGVLDQYGQAEAEQEVFNTLASAQRKRRALAEREAAEFSGASALSRSSLSSQIGRTY